MGLSLQVAQQAQSSAQWAELVLEGPAANPAGEHIILKAQEGSGRGLAEVSFDAVHTRLVSAKWSTLDGMLQMRFEDYQISESGLVYPAGMTVWQDDQLIEQITVQELRLNQPVEKALFEGSKHTVTQLTQCGVLTHVQTVVNNAALVGVFMTPERCSFYIMGVCPSGQRERAVNPSALPTVVRIHPPPPLYAGVAQLVEHQPSKLRVASSNLVSRSIFTAHVAQG